MKDRIFTNIKQKHIKKELDLFKAQTLKVINLSDKDEAKKSIDKGYAHLYCMLESGDVVISQKTCKQSYVFINHAVITNNANVRCAGEFQLRDIKIKGKICYAIDLNNSSGHYMPDAGQLMDVVAKFEELGYIVARIHAVHSQYPKRFLSIGNGRRPLNTINRASEVEDIYKRPTNMGLGLLEVHDDHCVDKLKNMIGVNSLFHEPSRLVCTLELENDAQFRQSLRKFKL